MSGFNNMLHFVGVVEDSDDMTNSGRVRVRAFGIHPAKKGATGEDDVPTDHLPWATVLDGTYGLAPIIPAVGEFVFGFFIDGRDAQQPIIMGRLPGMNFSFPAESGEPGEDGYIPPESIHKYGAPEMHRYNTGEGADIGQATLQSSYKRNNIKQADNTTFDEPPIAMPENNRDTRVIQSKNGDNFVVIGDGMNSDGFGTMLISHSSGSVFQIDPNGTIFVKSFSDSYTSTEGVQSTFVKGSQHTNIQEDYTLKIEKGSGKITIAGDLDIECRNFNVKASNQINLNAGAKINMSAGGIGMQATSDDINLVSMNNIKCKTGTFANGGGFYIKATMGDFHVDSYKTNMLSNTYTKIASNGIPAYSVPPPAGPLATTAQTVPYKDIGFKGIEIHSPVLVSVTSDTGIVNVHSGIATNISSLLKTQVVSTGAVDVRAGLTLNMSALGVTSVDGLLVNLGMLTADTSVITTASIQSLRNVQAAPVALPVTLECVTENATVVKPPTLPALQAVMNPVTTRVRDFITSTMGTGDSQND